MAQQAGLQRPQRPKRQGLIGPKRSKKLGRSKRIEKEEDPELEKMLSKLDRSSERYQKALHEKKYGSPLPDWRTGKTIPTHIMTEDDKLVYNPDKGSLIIGDKVYPRMTIKNSEGSSAKKKRTTKKPRGWRIARYKGK